MGQPLHRHRHPTKYTTDECEGEGGVGHNFDSWPLEYASRCLPIFGAINDETFQEFYWKVQYMITNPIDSPLYILIDSDGGAISNALSIYHCIRHIRTEYQIPVSTVCLGSCSSAASLLMAAGSHGLRYVVPDSYCMIHQTQSGELGGPMLSHVLPGVEFVKRLDASMLRHLARETVKRATSRGREVDGTSKQIEKRIREFTEMEMRGDCYLTADDMVRYGIADEVKVWMPFENLAEVGD